MKKTGAQLAVFALEQLGVKFTFGIPGTHTTELYDELNNSDKIEPVLVTHEGGAAFMADGVSRTSDTIGTLTIVPAAGTTHAMSGIGEAFLDGIPMLIISGGTRRDSGRHYQLHQLELGPLVSPITKGYFLIERHEDIIPTLYKAYDIATSGEPGPVFVEIPVELQLFKGEFPELQQYQPPAARPNPQDAQIRQAVEMLLAAEKPCIYVGWGAVDAADETAKLADTLVAPVSTTLQGKSALPANHPFHTGVGFGPTGLPAAQKTFNGCDCLITVGARFGEIATGSYGITVPENLIHIDINPEVFNKNYTAKLAIEGDATDVLKAINDAIATKNFKSNRDAQALTKTIADEKKAYGDTWRKEKRDDVVSPGFFFESLRKHLPEDVYLVIDDGKHTFLAAELFDCYHPRHFISPTDFNCMGYCVPATIGVKLTHPNNMVAAIVGDGAFLMTCMEMLTAVNQGVGIMVFIFHDGELGQISQFQKTPLNRKTCTVLGDFNAEGIAITTGAEFIAMKNDHEIDDGIAKAIEYANDNRPVIIDVNIDYSKKTMMTKGVIKTTLGRFPLTEKIRFVSRAVARHITG